MPCPLHGRIAIILRRLPDSDITLWRDYHRDHSVIVLNSAKPVWERIEALAAATQDWERRLLVTDVECGCTPKELAQAG